MNLKFLNTLIDPQDEVARVPSIAFAPNNRKVAIATADRHVYIYDDKFNRRDKFSTKPIDSQYGKKSYEIRNIVFSPDSTKLAVAQTDSIVFVYRLGENWDEKKVICNKFNQSSAASAITWPEENKLIIGLVDGRVRIASIGSNKCTTYYKTDKLTTAISAHPNRKSFVSGHIDGAIILYSFESRVQTLIVKHSTAPYCLLLTNFGIVAAGADRRIVSYTEQGRTLQQFDYNRDAEEKEFTVAVLDPSGFNVVIGSFDRLRLMTWNSRRGAWDEGSQLLVRNLYTLTALAWKPDGSTVVCGSLTGAVVVVDCCLKRTLLKGRFETTYVSPSQVVIRDTESERQCGIRSEKGLNITDIRIMGRTNRNVIAYTPQTLIVADMEVDKFSEIAWDAGGNEKFYFDNEECCMIINAGEISLIEYGRNEIIGWIRTERISPHLISVRLTEKRRRQGKMETRRVAYLLDIHTIAVVNLVNNVHLAQITHNSVIDWLELNETAEKLLFRDLRSALYLHDIEDNQTVSMINFCSYVQWVPQSDVVVAQNNAQLCVWYNAENPEQMVQIPIQGDVESVMRDQNRTEVIVQENNSRVAYELDSMLIEFGTAIDDLDLNRALIFLEDSEKANVDVAAMWRQLAAVAIQEGRLLIAQRCFAGLNDIARVRFIAKTIEMADDAGGADGLQDYRNAVDEALTMYQKLHKWNEALQLATATNYPDLEGLKSRYIRNLHETGQEDKAAEIRVEEGKPLEAVELYLRSNRPAMAAGIILDNRRLAEDEFLIDKVAQALMTSGIHDKVGELYELTGRNELALENYKKSREYAKAVNVARIAFPDKVIELEEEWGDYLFESGSHDAAISHFLECGKTEKAANAAIWAKEWEKALEILEVLESGPNISEFYIRIAEHFEADGEYDKAERYYLDANMPTQAIEMYHKANRWTDAYKLAAEFMDSSETHELYLQKATELEQSSRWKEAEELYVSVGEPNRAIAMYKAANRLEEMMQLVERFHSEHVDETHLRLAEDLEQNGEWKAAEEQYLAGGDWKAAVNMYKTANMWEDAYRIAKNQGGDHGAKQIAFLWAKSLGGDAAVSLLQTYGLLEDAIDVGAEKGEFEFVFELCRLGATNRLADVQLKYAEHLEDEGEYNRAEQFYLQAGKSREAVLMYIHNQQWEAAERLASAHCPDLLNDVYIGHARSALEAKDHERSESYLLRANRADIILTYYKEMGMWPDALRIARDYVPDSLAQLQVEYENVQLKSGARGADSFFAQARDWELQEDYGNAIACYMKVDSPLTNDTRLISQAYIKAGDLVTKFVTDNTKRAELVDVICDKLKSLKQHLAASEIYLSVDRPNDAVRSLIAANEWAKAKKVAGELAPDLEDEVDVAYREYLRNQGRVGELIDVDVISAIDMLIERGQWEKALSTAKQQNHQPLMDKYVAMYAMELMNNERFLDAVKVFEQYGAASNTQNFNIYKRLIDSLLNMRNVTFEMLASLRNMILNLNVGMQKSTETIDDRIVQIFDRYQYVLHYSAFSKALEEVEATEANRLRLKIKIALLRYVDLLQPDKLFYEAGLACRNGDGSYQNMAFAFLNHYLDIVDSIEENDPSLVDNTIFEGTDIPTQYSLPQQMFLTEDEHEDVKEWVLSVSVDQKVQKELKMDERDCYEASSVDSSGRVYPICILSAYPILNSPKELGRNKYADPTAWQQFATLIRTHPSDQLFDVQAFLSRWTGSSVSLV
ncbi:Intraflagellar transport protein osm-1 [Aphelenchoides besseyi]|nr:Intraflagellar transport protein osm-1 [Aphelenchoides besseyi]